MQNIAMAEVKEQSEMKKGMLNIDTVTSALVDAFLKDGIASNKDEARKLAAERLEKLLEAGDLFSKIYAASKFTQRFGFIRTNVPTPLESGWPLMFGTGIMKLQSLFNEALEHYMRMVMFSKEERQEQIKRHYIPAIEIKDAKTKEIYDKMERGLNKFLDELVGGQRGKHMLYLCAVAGEYFKHFWRFGSLVDTEKSSNDMTKVALFRYQAMRLLMMFYHTASSRMIRSLFSGYTDARMLAIDGKNPNGVLPNADELNEIKKYGFSTNAVKKLANHEAFRTMMQIDPDYTVGKFIPQILKILNFNLCPFIDPDVRDFCASIYDPDDKKNGEEIFKSIIQDVLVLLDIPRSKEEVEATIKQVNMLVEKEALPKVIDAYERQFGEIYPNGVEDVFESEVDLSKYSDKAVKTFKVLMAMNYVNASYAPWLKKAIENRIVSDDEAYEGINPLRCAMSFLDYSFADFFALYNLAGKVDDIDLSLVNDFLKTTHNEYRNAMIEAGNAYEERYGGFAWFGIMRRTRIGSEEMRKKLEIYKYAHPEWPGWMKRLESAGLNKRSGKKIYIKTTKEWESFFPWEKVEELGPGPHYAPTGEYDYYPPRFPCVYYSTKTGRPENEEFERIATEFARRLANGEYIMTDAFGDHESAAERAKSDLIWAKAMDIQNNTDRYSREIGMYSDHLSYLGKKVKTILIPYPDDIREMARPALQKFSKRLSHLCGLSEPLDIEDALTSIRIKFRPDPDPLTVKLTFEELVKRAKWILKLQERPEGVELYHSWSPFVKKSKMGTLISKVMGWEEKPIPHDEYPTVAQALLECIPYETTCYSPIEMLKMREVHDNGNHTWNHWTSPKDNPIVYLTNVYLPAINEWQSMGRTYQSKPSLLSCKGVEYYDVLNNHRMAERERIKKAVEQRRKEMLDKVESELKEQEARQVQM